MIINHGFSGANIFSWPKKKPKCRSEKLPANSSQPGNFLIHNHISVCFHVLNMHTDDFKMKNVMLLATQAHNDIVINPQSHHSCSCHVFDLTTWYQLPNEFLIIQFLSTFNPFFSPPLLTASLVSLTFPLLTHSVTLLMTSCSALLTQWPTYTVKERASAQLEDRKGERERDWGWWCSIQCAINRAVSGGAELKRGKGGLERLARRMRWSNEVKA